MQWRLCWWPPPTPISATPSPGQQYSLLPPMVTLKLCCAWFSTGPPGVIRLTAMSSRPCAASPPSSKIILAGSCSSAILGCLHVTPVLRPCPSPPPASLPHTCPPPPIFSPMLAPLMLLFTFKNSPLLLRSCIATPEFPSSCLLQ